MCVTQDKLAQFEGKIAKTIKIFFVKEVRSGSDTIILDPDPRHCNFGWRLNFSTSKFLHKSSAG
jgi:hypothetical protein